MALVWLKQILGDYYTEELEKQIEAKIGEGFVARTDFNGRIEELKVAKEQLTQRDADIAELKKGAGESDDLKKQITELQAKYKADAEKAAAELNQSKLNAAVELTLITAGARNVKATKALLEMDKVKLDGEQLLGLNEQIEALRKEQGFLFSSTQGVENSSPPPYNYQPQGGNPPDAPKSQTLHEVIAAEMAQRMSKPPQ